MRKTSAAYLLAHCAAALLVPLVPHAAAYQESGIAAGYPENVEDMDSREIAMLPSYCKHTQIFRDRLPGANDPGAVERWTVTMGPVFNAMHHYCFGLMKTNRALFIAKTPQYKKFYLESSIVEFDYVLHRAPPDFALLPEILTKKGENLIRLGRARAGLAELDKAAALKPDYWPPYTVMSDYYESAGDMGKAQASLERGLAASPDSKVLHKRLARFTAKRQSTATTPQQQP